MRCAKASCSGSQNPDNTFSRSTWGDTKGAVHVLAPQVAAQPAEQPAEQSAEQSAEDHYDRAFALEETDPEAAQRGYEASLAADSQHVEARINLGRLLHLAGRLSDAERVYRAADKPEAVLTFNLGVLLEDLEREAEALHAYREALALDPNLADAHFNLARLYEKADDARASLRHLLAYRRMMDRQGT